MQLMYTIFIPQDPQKSIPKGTLLAIVLTTISYLIIAVIAGWTVLRDASGEVLDVANWTMANCGHDCRYGLHHSNDVSEILRLELFNVCQLVLAVRSVGHF